MNSRRSLTRTGTLMKKNRIMVIVSNTILILATLVVAYPILFLIFTSLKDNPSFYANPFGIPGNPQWSNYPMAWSRGYINVYFFNSVIVSVSAVALTAVFSTLGGYALGKMHIPRSELIMAGFLVFSFVPGIAIYITLYKMMASLHLTTSRFSMILPYGAWHIPVSMYILKRFFETVPMDIVESARIDGCGELRTFLQVVLPLVKPALASVIVLSFIYNWGELMWAQIVTAASLRIKTMPIGLLSFRLEMGVDWGPYAAGLCIMTIPLMLVFGYFQKYFIAGLTQGSVKG